MPFPSPPRARSGPRRRSLLAAAPAALALAGCTAAGTEESADAGDGSSAAERRARARAARDSERLLQRYDAVIAARPALAGRLGPLRENVVRHAQAFGGGRKASPSGPASAAPPASASPPAAVPENDKEALAGLAAAERELADRRSEDLLGVPGELARLLASAAAAGAAHVYLLTEGDA
ncbi:hypothetical protein [Streptomyces sp. NPDC057838]|uniref:hypothetical protein n=1 Tax=unclassified Streptomyces TaxID=2593676 RepID=UPI003697CE3B